MTQALSKATYDGAVLGVSAPPTPGMLHLGIGNFHRAHAAVYTAKAMAAQGGDWGIVAVANRSRRVVDSLLPGRRRQRANTDPIGPYLEALGLVRREGEGFRL